MSIWRGSRGRKSFKKSDISKPQHFEHRIHADFDPLTGDIRGLPVQWQSFLSADFFKSRHKPIVDSECVTMSNAKSSSYKVMTKGDDAYDSNCFSKVTNFAGSHSCPSGMSPNSVFNTALNNGADTTQNGQDMHFKNSSSNNALIMENSTRTAANDAEFRAALLSVVDPTDPQANLSKFVEIKSGCTSNVFASYLLSKRRKVAVKCMNIWRQQRRELLFNEILVSRDLPRHAHLVECFSSHLICNELWVIMEFMEGGSLSDVIIYKRLEESLIATICRQCLDALSFLHERGIIHRDIKSDCILFAGDGTAKLSDFGFCGRLSAECPRRRSLLGTPYWFSAQVAAREPYGTDTDIWSFGITVIEMVFGEPPYFNDSPLVAVRKIVELPAATLPPAANASAELESFVDCMLVKEVSKRATAVRLLSHPFLYKAAHHSAILPILHEVQHKLAEKAKQKFD